MKNSAFKSERPAPRGAGRRCVIISRARFCHLPRRLVSAHLHPHSGGHGESGQERRRRQPEPDLQGPQARRQARACAGKRRREAAVRHGSALRPDPATVLPLRANRNELPSPFKVIQTDRVYRAERPQKGRLREFVQCDIDILGDSSPNAEVELIDVTARALLKIGFTGFTVNINDRRILRAMLEKMGFDADQLDSVCISFDKMDKIGADGVK